MNHENPFLFPFAKTWRGRWVGQFCLFIVLLLIVALANAQSNAPRVTPCNQATPSNAFCVSVTAPPTTREDGKPVTGALTYRGEWKLSSVSTWTSGAFSGVNLYVQNLAAGTYTVRVYASEAGVESAAAPTQSRAAVDPPASPPNPPGFVIAQVTVTVSSPAFRIIGQYPHATPGEFVAMVPVGRDCSGPILFRKHGYSFRQVIVLPAEAWQSAGPAPRTAAAPCVRQAS